MNCESTRHKLLDHATGIPDKIREEVAQHLNECADCAAFASIVRDTYTLIEKEKMVDFDPFMHQRIGERLNNPVPQVSKSLQRIMQPAFAAVLLAFVIFAGTQIGKKFSYDSSRANDYRNEWNHLANIHLETELLNELSIQQTDNENIFLPE